MTAYFLNISSMRRVTANPPAILTLVIATVAAAIQATRGDVELICRIAPMMMMLLMAFVTLISGVCSAGVTFQTTM